MPGCCTLPLRSTATPCGSVNPPETVETTLLASFRMQWFRESAMKSVKLPPRPSGVGAGTVAVAVAACSPSATVTGQAKRAFSRCGHKQPSDAKISGKQAMGLSRQKQPPMDEPPRPRFPRCSVAYSVVGCDQPAEACPGTPRSSLRNDFDLLPTKMKNRLWWDGAGAFEGTVQRRGQRVEV